MRDRPSDDGSPRVFVSRPSAITPPQRELEHQWLAGLSALGLAPTTVRRENYGPNPWSAIKHAVIEAHGALILGFRQTHVLSATSLPSSEEAGERAEWLPTPWNQIEAGMAITAGLPVLVVAEDGVADGVFASDTWKGEVRAAPIYLWASPEPTRNPAVQAWALAIRQRTS
jgi:hypothetical protein